MGTSTSISYIYFLNYFLVLGGLLSRLNYYISFNFYLIVMGWSMIGFFLRFSVTLFDDLSEGYSKVSWGGLEKDEWLRISE